MDGTLPTKTRSLLQTCPVDYSLPQVSAAQNSEGTFAATTFSGAYTSTSSTSTATSATLGATTPWGAVYGSTAGKTYLALRPTNAGTTSTFNFVKSAPSWGQFGFALGDIDAENVQISAIGIDDVPLTASELGFQGAFNYASGGTDLPDWDPSTSTLKGNTDGSDTSGASGWFQPTRPIKTLTLASTTISGIPSYQLWMAAVDCPAPPPPPVFPPPPPAVQPSCKDRQYSKPKVGPVNTNGTFEATDLFAGTFTSTSSTATAAAATLGPTTPWGTYYGSSSGEMYVTLRPTLSGTTSTFTFTTPPPAWSDFGFALGDIDAEDVIVSAVGVDDVPLTASELGFQSTFNYASGGTDLPEWDPATSTLKGNTDGADTNGAAAWFRPSRPIKTLILASKTISGIPSYQVWMAGLTCGAPAPGPAVAPAPQPSGEGPAPAPAPAPEVSPVSASPEPKLPPEIVSSGSSSSTSGFVGITPSPGNNVANCTITLTPGGLTQTLPYATPAIKYNLTGLNPSTKYTLEAVCAFLDGELSPTSSPGQLETGDPTQPAYLEAVPLSPTNGTATINAPDVGCTPSSYVVTVTPIAPPGSPQTVQVNATTPLGSPTAVYLGSLAPSTEYTLTTVGTCQNGEKTPTSTPATLQTFDEPTPSPSPSPAAVPPVQAPSPSPIPLTAPVCLSAAASGPTHGFVVFEAPQAAAFCNLTLAPSGAVIETLAQPQSRVSIRDLEPGVENIVSIKCFTALGQESPTSNPPCRLVTPADAKSPAYIEAQPSGEDSAVVTIIAPAELGCDVVQYKITYTPTDSTAKNATMTVAAAAPPADTIALLSGLVKGTIYEITTIGVCEDGTASPQSAPAYVDLPGGATPSPRPNPPPPARRPPPPARRPPPSSPRRPPPAPQGQVYGDPHIITLGRLKYTYHGTQGYRYTLLKDQGGLKISSLFTRAANTPPHTTIARDIVFTQGRDKVRVLLWYPDSKKQIKRLNATIGNAAPITARPVTVKKTMPGGTRVVVGQNYSPPAYVWIRTTKVNVLVTLRSPHSRPTNGLNIYVTTKTKLPGPLGGLLVVKKPPAGAEKQAVALAGAVDGARVPVSTLAFLET